MTSLLVGVIIGALAAGAVQIGIAWLDRRRAARAAARLLHGRIKYVRMATATLKPSMIFSPFIDWERLESDWTRYQDVLAPALKTGDIDILSRAALAIERVTTLRKRQEASPNWIPDGEQMREVMEDVLHSVTGAERTVRVASLTWREARRTELPAESAGSGETT
jgi:hypothetical protein